jgi:hypothetical protein
MNQDERHMNGSETDINAVVRSIVIEPIKLKRYEKNLQNH